MSSVSLSTRTLRRVLFLACAVFILVGSLPMLVLAGGLTVDASEGALSVHAVDVPLMDVLVAIGQRVRARMLIESILEEELGTERVTASFTRVAIDDALRRLLRSRNFILGLGPSGVDEIRVYVDGKTGLRALPATDRKLGESSPAPKPLGVAPALTRQMTGPPPENPLRLAQLRRAALASPDATARLEALDELAETQDTRSLLATVTEALARERDAGVLAGLLDIAQERGPIATGVLRTLASSDRNGAARAQALEMLADVAGAEPDTRALLRTLSRHDPSERVRDTAHALLEALETPRPLARPRQFPPKVKEAHP